MCTFCWRGLVFMRAGDVWISWTQTGVVFLFCSNQCRQWHNREPVFTPRLLRHVFYQHAIAVALKCTHIYRFQSVERSWWAWGVRLTVNTLDEVIGFFNWPNPSSRTMALVSTQPLTEMSTRNLPWCKKWLARKANNLTAICEPIV
jgi:hypothetical protein